MKQGLVPELRFPEFRDNGSWNDDKLFKLITTVTPPKKIPANLYQEAGQYPIIDQSQKNICGWTNDKEALILDDFPLIVFGDHTCILKIALEPFVQGADGIKILKAKDGLETDFLYQALQVQPVVMEEYKRHFSILKEKIVAFPKKESGEQQKIADCLSTLDELITAHTQKHQALQSYKKGLLQNLFPAEGETVPVLRFSEFRDAGDWHRGKLKKYIDLLSGYAFKSEYFSASGEKLLTPKNFTKSGFANFSEENTKFTVEECDSKYLCNEGDLLLLLTDLTSSCELLGKPILLREDDGKVLLNQRIVKVIPSQKVNNRFLLYFFLTDGYSNHIKNTASGSTVRHSSNKIVLDTDISFPSASEQQTIADCLSSVDDLITAQAQKIDELKEHKKGLMQQLFPAIPEAGL